MSPVIRFILFCPLCFNLLALAALGQELPVRAAAKAEARELLLTRAFSLYLHFLPEEDLHKPYQVKLAVYRGGRQLLRRDHSPQPATVKWRKGVPVKYRIRVQLPLNLDLQPGGKLKVYLGFYDPAERVTLSPSGPATRARGLSLLTTIALVDTPLEGGLPALITRAGKVAAAGNKRGAWDMLESAFRGSENYDAKAMLRKELLRLGDYQAPARSVAEQEIVRRRIQNEKHRYFREIAGQLHYRKKYRGALRLLELIGGNLEENVGKAVIGALADAKRNQLGIEDIKRKMLRVTDPEAQKLAAAEVTRLGLSERLLQRAREFLKKEDYPPALVILGRLTQAEDDKLCAQAEELLTKAELDYVNSTPSDQQAQVDAAVNHPAWERTATTQSHKFIYIGPRNLLKGIPDKSRLRFDIASIYITDLFGRVPNPSGDRVTVYFKELWQFGGGQGGGKIIDIGSAKPDARLTPVDTHLLFHEFTHCVDDTRPIHSGFREGLAELGAVFAMEGLGEIQRANRAIARFSEAFAQDYLARDLEYWRIQNYAPSAGFFVHFIDKYGRTTKGRDWLPFRRFFREYRRLPLPDGREPMIVRALGHFLVRNFGAGAFADLAAFRFPLFALDRKLLAPEVELYELSRDGPDLSDAEDFSKSPFSPVPRDALFRELLGLLKERAPTDEIRTLAWKDLGIIQDWKVIGPFQKDGIDPGAFVFPPEYEIDFSKKYDGRDNICRWRDPGPDPPVTRDAMGRYDFDFKYMNDTAFYALCHLSVPKRMPVFAHLRADDDLTLLVNDQLIGKFKGSLGRTGRSVRWRGSWGNMPDAIRFPLTLKAGRNKVLLKVRNRSGGSGFVCSFTDGSGRPIPGLTGDTRPPTAAGGTAKANPLRWDKRLKINFNRASAAGKLKATVGGFRVRKREFAKQLMGTSNAPAVLWRKYTVRPGFPRDAPANLAWLKEKYTKNLGDFFLNLDLVIPSGRLKLALTFQGEGGKDGLSGWTLIIHPGGGERLLARLERYDRLVYQAETAAFKQTEPLALSLQLIDKRLTVTLGNAKLFSRVPIRPIPGRHRIGMATFGDRPGVSGLELKARK